LVPLTAALTLRLAYREPFDGGALLAFLAARAIPGVEEVTGNRYARTIRSVGGPGLVELILPAPTSGRGHVVLRVRLPRPDGRFPGPESRITGVDGRLPGPDAADPVVSRCRQLLDLDTDAEAIAAALAADDLLAPLVQARPGLRVPGAYDGFELAVRAVLGQQVSVAAASTLAGRLAARFGTRLAARPGTRLTARFGTQLTEPPGRPSLVFPAPADLAGADLSGLGLTGARQATLRALAAAVASGDLALDHGADPQEAAARVSELPGIGPWTVAYIRMRALGDRDAFPGTDLGLRRALADLGCQASRADRWRPWRAYAAVHLWTWHAASRR
jgi:AraC family transcriptional regulator, regulatory protein of adaptative response / DNA-3-methyladenine glycosylase II